MYIISHILSHLLPFFYLVLVIIYYRIFFRKSKTLSRLTVYLLPLLLIFHGAEIVFRLVYLSALPFSTTFDSISFLAFSVIFVYYFMEIGIENKASGLFIMVFALILVLIATLNYNWQPVKNELLANQMYLLHAILGLTGYTALSISAIYALMYLFQERNMKKRNFNILFDQMMPLDYLGRLTRRSVIIGIIILGIALLLSHIHLYIIFGRIWKPDPKIIVTDFIWLVYVTGLITSRTKKLSPRFMGYVSLFGFLVLLVGGIVFVAIFNSFHQFY